MIISGITCSHMAVLSVMGEFYELDATQVSDLKSAIIDMHCSTHCQRPTARDAKG